MLQSHHLGRILCLSMSSALILAACTGGGSTSAPASILPSPPASLSAQPSDSAPALAYDPLSDQELIAKAQAEGKFTCVCQGEEAFRAVASAFEERFGIVVENAPGSTPQNVERLTQEAASGNITIDVFQSGDIEFLTGLADQGTLTEITAAEYPIVQQYPEYTRFQHWVYSGAPLYQPWYNTNVVANPPSSYAEILDDTYGSGLLGYNLLVSGSAGEFWLALEREIDPNYLTALTELDPTVFSEQAQLIAALASGEIGIAVSAFSLTAVQTRDEGAPIAPLDVELVTGGERVFVIPRNSPNPNAAVLFWNWIYSEEGAAALYADGSGASFIEGGVDGMLALPDEYVTYDLVQDVTPEMDRLMSILHP